MNTTLLISTYNWPEALDLVLKSLSCQNLLPGEVLIADDGSAPKTEEIIRKYRDILPISLNHVWHEDKGFRRTVILNKALAQANGDYIIQLDGDCLMHPNFVKDHINVAQKGSFLFGSRVNIKKEYLKELFVKEKIHFNFFDQGIKKRTRNIHFPIFGNFYKEEDQLSSKLRGCNLSFWKSDFLKINGYNEDMTGWGMEDSEMAVRLLNNGVLGKRLRYQGIIYHIWHKESSHEKVDRNIKIQQNSLKNELKYCENGIQKYL